MFKVSFHNFHTLDNLVSALLIQDSCILLISIAILDHDPPKLDILTLFIIQFFMLFKILFQHSDFLISHIRKFEKLLVTQFLYDGAFGIPVTDLTMKLLPTHQTLWIVQHRDIYFPIAGSILSVQPSLYYGKALQLKIPLQEVRMPTG